MRSTRHRVALVEDEPMQRTLLAGMLEAAGFLVSAFTETLELRRSMAREEFDLIVLDWELPNETGLELLRSLRATGVRTPVIFLTASEDERRVVDALDVGADDYVTKPPKSAELSARIRAVIRRALPDHAQHDEIECPPYVIDLQRGKLRLYDRVMTLTRREFELAAHFFQRRGQSVSRDSLMIQVWNRSPRVSTRSIDTFVSRLRKKLGLDGTHGWKLEAVYQRGYRLASSDVEILAGEQEQHVAV